MVDKNRLREQLKARFRLPRQSNRAQIAGLVVASLCFVTAGVYALSGDPNGDGKLDLQDIFIIASHYNKTGASLIDGDLNGDRVVNIFDLSILMTNFPKFDPNPVVTIVRSGPEKVIFDNAKNGCSYQDIPDLPPRAFRDASGQVNLIATNTTAYREIGSSLSTLHHDCAPIMYSAHNPDPSVYHHYEWPAAPYTLDGKTVYMLIHDEFHGNEYPNLCPSRVYTRCWHNAVTLGVSSDGGKSYSHPATSANLVANVPYKYPGDIGHPTGYFTPSNIIKSPKDNFYYSLLHAEAYQAQKAGVCIMRTKNLADPKSWRAWDGNGYNIQFANPYLQTIVPTDHICPPVAYAEIEKAEEGITYNTFLGKFLLIGGSQDVVNGQRKIGLFYSTSDDLIHWTHRQLLWESPLAWSWKAGQPNPIGYSMIIDPASPERNFDTSGQNPFLYIVRFNQRAVNGRDRSIISVPLHITKQ